uniref:Integrase catalytic domain-containing protein n=1 Tax=Tanacetum cinerariifolium TaxID=118510 RepID=A0A6L2NJL0_TANCI|nr:hypothetical protein [Tanacetum cinerariifolium]
MVNSSLKKLKYHLASIDVVVKERTTATAITEGTWGFEHTKACFNDEIIPFVKALKYLFNSFDQFLIDELSEVQNVFNQMELAVEQHRVESNRFQDKMKEVLNENERLLEQAISKDIVNIVVTANVNNAYELVNESLKDTLRKLKEKYVVDEAVTLHPIDPELLKIDVAPLAPKLRNNRTVHYDYLKHAQGETVTLRELVENERLLNPLNTSLYYACKTKKDRIQKTQSRSKKNKLEAYPRNVRTSLHNKKSVVKTKDIASVPNSKLNVKFDLQCVRCNGCLFSNNHDSCVLEFINSINARVKSISAKKPLNRKIWKQTGKMFTNIGYKWRPTGRTFTIVGYACPLTRITTTAKVPLKKSIPLESNTSKHVVVQIVLWYLDSGCSKHMTGDRSQLTNFVNKFLGRVKFGNDHVAKIIGYGDYKIGNVTISRVYFVEGLGHNLFSVGQFCDSDLEVAFRQHTYFIRNFEGVYLLTGSRGNNLYTLSLGDMMASSPICILSKASKTKSWLWHRHLSHPNFGAIDHLARQGLFRGLPKLKFEKDHLCFACAMGKSKKKSHKPKSEDTNQEKLYLLHMDLCGPMRVKSVNGKKYILVIVDDYSRFTWVKCLRSNDEAPDFIIKFLKMIQVRLKVPVRRIRTDNETKFVNQTLREYYEQVGISHKTSVARSSQQNGVIERRNRTLIEAARTMLIYAQAPLFLWVEAVATACYIQNRSIIRLRHGKTPYELLHNKLPDLSFLHVFGALCYPTNDSDNLGKLQPKADIGIFIGYAPTKKAFRIYNRRLALHEMTPATISSRLVPKSTSSTPFMPSSRNDWDLLFQPLFDELLTPPPSVDPQLLNLLLQTMKQYKKTQPHVIPHDVEEDNHDIKVAHIGNDPLFGMSIPEVTSDQSSSTVSSHTIVHLDHQIPQHNSKWTKDHPLNNRIGQLARLVSRRLQLHKQSLFCYNDAFLTFVEPKTYKYALTQSYWIEAMQEYLNEFECLEV